MKEKSTKKDALHFIAETVPGHDREDRPKRVGNHAGKSPRSKWVGLVPVALIVAGFLNLANESQAKMITRIGEYYLGEEIKTAHGLVELKPEEYAVLRSFPGWFDLPDEKVFDAPKVTFNRHLWHLTVAALNGRIYTLMLQYISNNRASANSVLKEMLRFVKSQMGAPTEQTKTPERYVWVSIDGSITLTERGATGFWSINFVLTGKPPRP